MTGRNAPRNMGNTSPIALARINAGLTQAQLARLIGCHGKDISRWERSHIQPRVGTLVKIANATGCRLTDLV